MELNSINNLYGLIGFPLSHSFSKKYFKEKFEKEGIADSFYELFPLQSIEEFPDLIAQHPNLKGLNVTIPYKQAVMPFLDEIDKEAEAVGAVNTIRIKDGKLKGFNTDVYGFEHSLHDFLQDAQKPVKKALILGTGGAAKAIAYVLKKMEIDFLLVSRSVEKGDIDYKSIDGKILSNHLLIVNTTPLGMYPSIDTFPDISYHYLTEAHYLYDLVYNPEITSFMSKGAAKGAKSHNGLRMLYLQAEKAWEIWNQK
jgi:shikimate dehydrogenase